MRIHSEGLALPVTHKFTNAITVMLNENCLLYTSDAADE